MSESGGQQMSVDEAVAVVREGIMALHNQHIDQINAIREKHGGGILPMLSVYFNEHNGMGPGGLAYTLVEYTGELVPDGRVLAEYNIASVAIDREAAITVALDVARKVPEFELFNGIN